MGARLRYISTGSQTFSTYRSYQVVICPVQLYREWSCLVVRVVLSILLSILRVLTIACHRVCCVHVQCAMIRWLGGLSLVLSFEVVTQPQAHARLLRRHRARTD